MKKTSGMSPHFSRRGLLMIAANLSFRPVRVLAFAKSDFWNQKDPLQWSAAERERILTNSPWAHKATLDMGGDMGGGPPGGGPPMPGGGPPMGGGRGGPPGDGGPMGGGRGGPPNDGGGPGGMPEFKVVVRWQSAAPLMAVAEPTPSYPADAYVIGVSGLPPMNMGARNRRRPAKPDADLPDFAEGPDEETMLDSMRQSARLQTKGQASLRAREVHREDRGDESYILFHFDRGELPLTPASKDVSFTLKMGMLELTAKFVPKDMIYKGQLAV